MSIANLIVMFIHLSIRPRVPSDHAENIYNNINAKKSSGCQFTSLLFSLVWPLNYMSSDSLTSPSPDKIPPFCRNESRCDDILLVGYV